MQKVSKLLGVSFLQHSEFVRLRSAPERVPESAQQTFVRIVGNLAHHPFGQASGGLLNYPAMYTSMSVPGSLVLDVNGNRLDATFLDSSRVRRDYFRYYRSPRFENGIEVRDLVMLVLAL